MTKTKPTQSPPEPAETDLPEGWATIALGEVVSSAKGKKPPDLLPERHAASVPYIDIRAFETGQYREFTATESAKLASEGSLLIVWDGARSGLVGRMPCDGAVGSTLAVLHPRLIDTDYLQYFLQANFDFINSNTRGTGIPHVDPGTLWNVEFPVAPLAEQERIVAKVEELLARVNAARARLDKLPAILKRFRQSVLAAACSGQLTADWRDQQLAEPADVALARSAKMVDTKSIRHLVRRGTEGLPTADIPEIPSTWASRSVRQLVEAGAIVDFQDGNHGSLYPRSTDFGDSGVKFLTAAQVFDNRVLLDEAPLLKREKAKVLRIGFAQPMDVLLTHNATVGRVAILPKYEGKVILGTSVTYYRANADVLLPEYLCFAMQGQVWQDQLRSVMEQTTRNQVSVTKQVEFLLLIPPIEEQREIVRRVEALFALADKIDARIQAASARVEKTTQAILAKAFRGELVPTEAELARRDGRPYESAADLLGRIHGASAAGQHKGGPVRALRARKAERV